MRARFEREARITAKLQHPSIVNVIEAGQWPLLFARFTALPILVLTALVQFRNKWPAFGRQLVVPAAAVGVLIAGSNASYLISTREGLLSLVAVVVAMYPASTIVLASIIDGERATRSPRFRLARAGGPVTRPHGRDRIR